MAWHSSTALYEFTEDSLHQDFELFPSTTSIVSQGNNGSTPSPVTVKPFAGARPSNYGPENMVQSIDSEQAWLSWCHAGAAQDIHTLPVIKARAEPSISDSGYGSVEHTDRHAVDAEQSKQTTIADSMHHQVPQYCEICYQGSEKRRYFSNNADRRKHMLTHTRPFKCDVSGCDNHNGFASPHDLARHKKTCHSLLTVKTSTFYYRCAAPACQKKDKIWPRKDNFKAHLEGTHKYDEVQVAELLVKSECTPDSVQLSTGIGSRQRVMSKKLQDKRGSHKEFLTDNEGSTNIESPAGEVQQDFGANNVNDSVSEHWVSPTIPTETSNPSFQSCQSTPAIEYTHPPSILISDESEVDVCEQSSAIEMMDTTTDFMDSLHSPYFMVSASSSPYAIEHPPTPCTSSTYADSLFESDADEVSTDTEFDVDMNGQETVFQPLLVPAVHQLLTAYFVLRQNAGGEKSTYTSNPSSFESRSGPSRSSMPPTGSKRRRDIDEDRDDNEDEQLPRRRSKVIKTDEDLPPLACPFNKLDPIKHDRCYAFILKGISRVKQHLERVHSKPVHCPKCYSIFRNNPEARDKHVRQETCQNAPERRLEGIDEATMRKLKRRVTGKSSVQESWYSIFNLLFPGARKPESPFMDTSLSAELSAFRDFCTLEGRDIVANIVDASMPSWSHSHEQLEDFTRQVFRSAVEHLFRQWPNRSRTATNMPAAVHPPVLPPTPTSTFIQDLNDMGVGGAFLGVNDEEPLLPISQQYQDVDMQWMAGEPQQHLQWMYFGDIPRMDQQQQQQQFCNDHGVLDGMGGWSV